MKAVVSLLGLFVTMPIWYYLLYQIMVRVNATELMWFLYWIYLPVALLTHVLTKLSEKENK